jgi:hypothetical protein
MKTRTTLWILAILLPVLILVSCENAYWTCLRGNGVIETETREPGVFSGVVSEGAFEVIYVADSDYSVEIETDENLIKYIRTLISGNTLIVDNGTRKCLRSEYPIRVYVHSPEIERISLEGSGMISADSISGGLLRLEITGSGNIDLRNVSVADLEILITGSGNAGVWGESETSAYTITGSGNITAQHLFTAQCIAEISGTGTIYCHASEKLDAIISGSGNIFYTGYPSTVNTYISGTGSVSTMN